MEHRDKPEENQSVGGMRLQDGGESVAIGVHKADGMVVMTFPQPVTWVGMKPKFAEEVAALLLRYARMGT